MDRFHSCTYLKVESYMNKLILLIIFLQACGNISNPSIATSLQPAFQHYIDVCDAHNHHCSDSLVSPYFDIDVRIEPPTNCSICVGLTSKWQTTKTTEFSPFVLNGIYTLVQLDPKMGRFDDLWGENLQTYQTVVLWHELSHAFFSAKHVKNGLMRAIALHVNEIQALGGPDKILETYFEGL